MLIRKCRKCGKQFEFAFRQFMGDLFKFADSPVDYEYLFCDSCREAMRKSRDPIWQSILIYSFMISCIAAAFYLAYKPPVLLAKGINWFKCHSFAPSVFLVLTLPLFIIIILFKNKSNSRNKGAE